MGSSRIGSGGKGSIGRVAALAALGCAVVAMSIAGASFAAHGGGGGVVLGAKKFAPNGKGFGHPHPKTIFNGGDPNGLVSKIKWKNWGSSAARGHGKGNGFKPGGGYYPKPVKVHLRAYKIGTCGHSKRRAYTKMQAQFEKKPGSGKFGKWLDWGGSKSICKFVLPG